MNPNARRSGLIILIRPSRPAAFAWSVKNMNKIKIVAECGCNHQGSFSIAREMILEAKRCGCDYVKFQKRYLGAIPAELADKPYLSEHSFGNTYLAHRTALELDGQAWRELQLFAEKEGIGFFGTAFDLPSAEFLVNINVPYIKIGSAQNRDVELIRDIRELRNCPPLIWSAGMMDGDMMIDYMLKVNPKITVHCTSSYPCPISEINLGVLTRLKFLLSYKEFGLSGHYIAGNGAIEAAAVALGATYIERHFTLDRTWKGSDHACSLEPVGMMNVVKAVRQIEVAMGDGIKEVMPSEVAVMEKLGISHAD